MIGIDVAPELVHADRRKRRDELFQRPKAARVELPDILGAAMVAVAQAPFEFQIEGLPEQLLDMRRVSPSQRRHGGRRCVTVLGYDAEELRYGSLRRPSC